MGTDAGHRCAFEKPFPFLAINKWKAQDIKALSPTNPCERFLRKPVWGITWWEWMRAALFSLSSLLSQLESRGLETLLLFFPRCWPVLGSAFRGETLPKLGQAAQKQMRSDTGAEEYSPEPPPAHITKCSTPRSLRHPSRATCWRGMRDEREIIRVCLWMKVENRDVRCKSRWLLGWFNYTEAWTGIPLSTSKY